MEQKVKLKEALFFVAQNDDIVQCQICPHNCVVLPAERALCGVRLNRSGTLYTENYARVAYAEPVDLETTPFQFFIPQGKALMVGSKGCNLRCPFCSTWEFTMGPRPPHFVSPEELIAHARKQQTDAILFNYNEPLTYLEYLIDCVKLAKSAGLATMTITNGFANREPWRLMMRYVDFVAIDLKGWQEDFYLKEVGGSLKFIKDNLNLAIKEFTNLSLTLLVIEGKNDQEAELNQLFSWVQELKPELPLFLVPYRRHFSYPASDTSTVRMQQVLLLARKYLRNTYILS